VSIVRAILFGMTLVVTVSAEAGFVVQPASVASSDYTPINSNNVISNLITQGGLAATYTSGVTDFDTYIGSLPTHTFGVDAFESGDNQFSGNIDFDLGGDFQIESFAIWNRGGNSAHNVREFTLFADDNSMFTSPVTLGTFLADPQAGVTGNQIPVEVFTFASTSASFVRMTVTSTNGGTRTAFHEVAFEGTSVAAVPEPSSSALLGLGMLIAGCFAIFRRSHQVFA